MILINQFSFVTFFTREIFFNSQSKSSAIIAGDFFNSLDNIPQLKAKSHISFFGGIVNLISSNTILYFSLITFNTSNFNKFSINIFSLIKSKIIIQKKSKK